MISPSLCFLFQVACSIQRIVKYKVLRCTLIDDEFQVWFFVIFLAAAAATPGIFKAIAEDRNEEVVAQVVQRWFLDDDT